MQQSGYSCLHEDDHAGMVGGAIAKPHCRRPEGRAGPPRQFAQFLRPTMTKSRLRVKEINYTPTSTGRRRGPRGGPGGGGGGGGGGREAREGDGGRGDD